MSPPWDVFGVGCAVGGAVGLVGGYQLRKLVVRVQDWRANRYRKASKKYDKLKAKAVETGEPIITAQQRPQVIPIARKFKRVDDDTFKVEQPIPVISSDRDDVIAALMGAGYKKADAIKAADACSLVERASGLQQWTIAALRNAHGAK